MKNKIILTLAAGALLLSACQQMEKVTVNTGTSVPPVLGEHSEDAKGVTAAYTDATFYLGAKPVASNLVNYCLAIVKADDKEVSAPIESDNSVAGTVKAGTGNISSALVGLGYDYGETVNIELKVRARLSSTAKNGYLDSEGSISITEFEIAKPSSGGLPDLKGYGFYVDNSAAPAYAEMALYAWGDGLSDKDDLFGGWPGMQPTGSVEIGGTTFVYFDLGEKTIGKTVNFIINNNGAGQQLEHFDCFKNQVIDHDFFFKITDDSVEEVEVNVGPAIPDVDLSGHAVNDAMGGANTWGLIGPAQPGGWETDTDLVKVKDDPEIWCVENIELAGDKFKFRGNDEWKDYDLGGGTVALDTIIELSKGGGDMSIEAGTYTVYLFPTYMVCYITK